MAAPTPDRYEPRLHRLLLAAAAFSMVAWALLLVVAPRPPLPWSEEMLDAARRMAHAVDALGEQVAAAGQAAGPHVDPNRTGLIGPPMGEFFTTLGQLEAKRTTTAPDMAALLVHLLEQAGVGRGDTIAVAASGSFPGLLVATAAAAAALDAHPIIILSLGASSYGAVSAALDLLAYHDLLVRTGLLETPPAAVSLGGAGDVGADLEPALREDLIQRLARRQVPFIDHPDLSRNVALRMAFYQGTTLLPHTPAPREAPPRPREPRRLDAPEASPGDGRIAAFVNIGGSTANVGTSPLVLEVPPGLVRQIRMPAPERRGVMHAMAATGVPVIHLLHIRGLASRFGLPWDPVPLPPSGSTRLRHDAGTPDSLFVGLAVAYMAILTLLAGAAVQRGRSRNPRQQP
jgi:poly-gamma-glutamate system protein